MQFLNLWMGAVLLLACSSLFSACTTRSAQHGPTFALDADVDDQLGGTGIESGDVRGAADEIARALAHDLKREHAGTRVAVMPVLNRTRYRIDPAVIQNHLIHDLMKQSKKRFSIVAVRDTGEPATANAVLKTELRSLTKDNGEITADYIEYWFALEGADGTLLWSGMYETKRASAVDVVYQ